MRRQLSCTLLLLLFYTLVFAQPDAPLPPLEVITSENASRVEQVGLIGFGEVRGLAYSPNGATVAVAAGTLGVTFYDSEAFDRAPYHRMATPDEFTVGVAYHPDGEWLATVGTSLLQLRHEGTTAVVRLWDIATETQLAAWKIENKSTSRLVFSPDGTELAFANFGYYEFVDNDVPVWDVSNSEDVQLLPITSWSEIQRRWYAPNASPDLLQHEQPIAYSPDGTLAAYMGARMEDGLSRLSLVDAGSGALLFTFEPEEMSVESLFFTLDSRFLVAQETRQGRGRLRIWDTRSGDEVLVYFGREVYALAVHPTEPAILFSPDGVFVQYWRVGDSEPRSVLGQLGRDNIYRQQLFSPDGQTLAAIHSGVIEFWDLATFTKSAEINLIREDAFDYADYFGQIAYSPDGTLLAAKNLNASIYLFDTATLNIVSEIYWDPDHSFSPDMAFSPDGKLIAVMSSSESDEASMAVYLWDVQALTAARTMKIGQEAARIYFTTLRDGFYQMVFSSDSETLAIAGINVELWRVDDVLHWRDVGRGLDAPHYDAMLPISRRFVSWSGRPLAFSSDGARFVTRSNIITCDLAIWDLQAAEITICLRPVNWLVQLAIFTPDNSVLLTGATISTSQPEFIELNIRLWDSSTGEALATLSGHLLVVRNIAMSTDGKLIASSGGDNSCAECDTYDGTIRLWGVPAS